MLKQRLPPCRRTSGSEGPPLTVPPDVTTAAMLRRAYRAPRTRTRRRSTGSLNNSPAHRHASRSRRGSIRWASRRAVRSPVRSWAARSLTVGDPWVCDARAGLPAGGPHPVPLAAEGSTGLASRWFGRSIGDPRPGCRSGYDGKAGSRAGRSSVQKSEACLSRRVGDNRKHGDRELERLSRGRTPRGLPAAAWQRRALHKPRPSDRSGGRLGAADHPGLAEVWPPGGGAEVYGGGKHAGQQAVPPIPEPGRLHGHSGPARPRRARWSHG